LTYPSKRAPSIRIDMAPYGNYFQKDIGDRMSDFENMTTPPPPPMGTPSADERQWGLFAHLSTLVGLIIPFGSILGPLVVWLIKKDTMPFVDDQGKEALNFNITALLAFIVSGILMFVLIGFLLIFVVFIAWLVLSIMAAMAANKGEAYRYPFTLRLIK
jgi:uncharacterized Tic20 family protein